MRYDTKSVMVGKKSKRDEEGNCTIFVHLFSINDPHKTDVVPDKFLEFDKIHKIEIRGLDITYLLGGQDILFNNLKYIDIEQDEYDPRHHLIISGKQD